MYNKINVYCQGKNIWLSTGRLGNPDNRNVFKREKTITNLMYQTDMASLVVFTPRGGGRGTPSHNKWGCAILTKK